MNDKQNNVFINVYRILPCVGTTLFCCDSTQIYHSGVQVHSTEFSYGGGEGEGSGICRGVPRAAGGCVFSESIPMGHTQLDILEAMAVVRLMAAEWTLDLYDPFEHNCNHFSTALCERLGDYKAPGWLNNFTSCACFFRPIMNCCMQCANWIVEYDLLPTEAELPPETSLSTMDTMLHDAALTRKMIATDAFKQGDLELAITEYNKSLSYMQRSLQIQDLDLEKINQLVDSSAVTTSTGAPSESETAETTGRDAAAEGEDPSAQVQQAWQEDTTAVRSWALVEAATESRVLVATLYCNLAACHLKSGSAKDAISACDDSLLWSAQNPKALFRRGCAHCLMNDFEDAVADLQMAVKLAPADRTVRAELKVAKKGLEQQRQQEKDLCVRMFAAKSDASSEK